VRLTPKQAAERLSVSLSLVYQLLRQRKIPAYRVGVRGRGKWLIEEQDLNVFLATCKVEELSMDESDLKFLR
jgi:excisionase family DNA binding protein